MTIESDIALFSAQAASGNGASARWHGGRGVFAAYGTFGGGTVKLQWSPDDGTTWLDVDNGTSYVTFTANGSGGFELPNCLIRASLSGATSPSVSAMASITTPHS
jgi:hypothetical protein